MNEREYRVVVGDDHTLVRQSVVKAIAAEDGLLVVGEAADGTAALQVIAVQDPDLAVLDISMPGLDGLQVAERLARSQPQVDVLFLTMHDDDTSLQRALSLGARGYVSKSASISELIAAITTIRAGGSYLSAEVANRVMRLASGETVAPIQLTAREREVLELLADGQRPGDIADALFLSVKTVKNHLTNVYQKLQVETGAQAVAEAFRAGLVKPR